MAVYNESDKNLNWNLEVLYWLCNKSCVVQENKIKSESKLKSDNFINY